MLSSKASLTFSAGPLSSIKSSGMPLTKPTRKCQRRSEEHTSELQSRRELVCRLLREKKKFFRAATLHDSLFVLQQMFGGAKGVWLLKRWHMWLIAASFIVATLEEKWETLDRHHKEPQ